MGVRVTLTRLLSSTAMAGGVRVTGSRLLAATALKGPIRVTGSRLLAATALRGPIRVTGSYLIVAQSAQRGIEFNRLESNSQIFGLTKWTVQLVNLPLPEHNPYRPTIPESIIDTAGSETYDYLKENQEIQREQHNLTQAGDTTFPYQLLLKGHDSAQYRLGAISKFYHEDYGLIHGRYVQFTQMVPTASVASPCGLILKKKGQKLKWEVTNQFDKSHPDLVVGVLAPYTQPTEGQFGWVITDGPNLQSLINENTTSEIGESFVWSGDGAVSTEAQGRVLARRVYKTKGSNTLGPGHLHVKLESAGVGTIHNEIAEKTADVRADVGQLQTQVESLSQIADANVLTAIKKSIATLAAKLNSESGQRSGGDSALNARIDALDSVTQVILDNSIETLRDWIESQITILNGATLNAYNLAQYALDRANLFSMTLITNLQAQIDTILAFASEINVRPKGRFPVVDGAVPPNLVYMDDGSLVYTEIF